MKISGIDPEYTLVAARQAKVIGLDVVDDSCTYSIYKVGSKSHSFSEKDGRTFICYGNITLAGNRQGVAICISGFGTWFTTSKVTNVIEDEEGYLITTLNSYYKLIKDKI